VTLRYIDSLLTKYRVALETLRSSDGTDRVR